MPEKLRFQSYSQWAEAITPQLQAALTGEREVPPQTPFSEPWLAYALFLDALSPIPLKDIIAAADFINHDIPNPDEIAWAFLQLRRRGWLVEQGSLYGLAAEGRRAIEAIVGEGSVLDRVERLKEWTSAHPPPDHE